MKFSKNILIFMIITSLLILLSCSNNPNNTNIVNSKTEINLKDFNDCLGESGMIIYGSKTCPACGNLINLLGGYEKASSIYVECTENRERCQKETKTNYVPEIHIDNEIYNGKRTLKAFSEITGCSLIN
jgi:hypothetical protein